MKQQRLAEVLLARKAVHSEREAFVIVTEGRVYVNGQKAISPGQTVSDSDVIEVRAGREFVGRGAQKLDAALREFNIDVRGAVCADVGAATGGFTEVLLKHGAAKVYAIDTGRGKLDLKLRQDPRVVVMEETNVLAMPPLPELVGLISIDVSLTSLRFVLPKILPWLSRGGSVVALFKPQYEVEDKSLLEHGILRDVAARAKLVGAFRTWLKEHGWRELGFMESPIRGSEGNVEYLWHLVSV